MTNRRVEPGMSMTQSVVGIRSRGLLAILAGALVAMPASGQVRLKDGFKPMTLPTRTLRKEVPVPNPTPAEPVRGPVLVPWKVPYGVGGRGYGDYYDGTVEGVSVRGSYDDGNISLHFHTGSSISTQLMRQHAISTRYLVNRYPYRCGYYDLYGYRSPYRHYAIQGYYTPDPSLVTTTASAPAPEVPPPAPPTPLEVGAASMQAGEIEVAIDAYKEHLRDEPEDAWAMRQLGICMMESDRIEDGIAVLRHAYRTDPMLAEQPVARLHFALDAGRLRALVNRTVRHAHRTESASAWLGVTALMQAEGRKDVARRMLDRAEKAGLETEVTTRFNAALR